MHDYLVSYLQWVGFSVCTLVVALCVRVPAAHAAMPAPEPRYSAPPPQRDMAAPPIAQTEEERIADLEARLTALSGEIMNLTKALDVLGPLPDHADLFIPVALSELDEPAQVANPLADMRHAGLGAVGGLAPQSADLGSLRGGYNVPSHNVRLNDDRAEAEIMAALCVELAALAGPPRVVAPIRAG